VPGDRRARGYLRVCRPPGHAAARADPTIISEKPDTSVIGIVLAGLSLAVKPTLAWFKRRTGQQLGSRTLIADSAETFPCAWLSAILLFSLALNATVGWWWADPLAALGIAFLAVREGLEAWRGD
jgi:divalent metal cation (Fe/Co/Zn/Cd) transporter